MSSLPPSASGKAPVKSIGTPMHSSSSKKKKSKGILDLTNDGSIFKSAIKRIVKDINQNGKPIHITRTGLSTLCKLVVHFLLQMADNTSLLITKDGRKTVTKREVETAVSFAFGGDMLKCILREMKVVVNKSHEN